MGFVFASTVEDVLLLDGTLLEVGICEELCSDGVCEDTSTVLLLLIVDEEG